MQAARRWAINELTNAENQHLTGYSLAFFVRQERLFLLNIASENRSCEPIAETVYDPVLDDNRKGLGLELSCIEKAQGPHGRLGAFSPFARSQHNLTSDNAPIYHPQRWDEEKLARKRSVSQPSRKGASYK